jgi:ribosomal protein L31E
LVPTKVENDRYEEYSECIDQIFEIIQKYQNSHEIVIDGDFNDDISKNNNPRRASKLRIPLLTDRYI